MLSLARYQALYYKLGSAVFLADQTMVTEVCFRFAAVLQHSHSIAVAYLLYHRVNLPVQRDVLHFEEQAVGLPPQVVGDTGHGGRRRCLHVRLQKRLPDCHIHLE